MDLLTFLRGIVIGLSIGAPFGPVGLVCLRRMLTQGGAVGLASGLGAATADAAYAAIAGFGLTFLSGPLVSHQGWLGIAGGAILCALGVRTFFARPREVPDGGASNANLLRAYTSVLLLTLTSPATVLSFLAVFAGLGVVREGGRMAVGVLVAGVFAGSAFWWLAMAGGAGALKRRLSVQGLTWVNRLSGALIVAFGAVVLAFSAGGR